MTSIEFILNTKDYLQDFSTRYTYNSNAKVMKNLMKNLLKNWMKQSFEDGNGRTGKLLINYELLKNDLPPVVIAKEDRVKYFEFLRNNDSNGLAEWLKKLSVREKERMGEFGHEKK